MFDGFYDQMKAKKVKSCDKLMSNPKSTFLEFLSVENLDSIFAIFLYNNDPLGPYLHLHSSSKTVDFIIFGRGGKKKVGPPGRV